MNRKKKQRVGESDDGDDDDDFDMEEPIHDDPDDSDYSVSETPSKSCSSINSQHIMFFTYL